MSNELTLHDPFVIPDVVEETGGHLPRVVYAYEMRIAGVDWLTISEKLGYASQETARDAVLSHIRGRYNQQDIEEIVNLELLRLDRLMLICYAQAKNGDLKAVREIANLMTLRMKFLGTEKKANESGTSIQNAAFFIGGESTTYIDALQQARQQAGVRAVGE